MRYATVLLDVGGTLVGPRKSFGEIYATVLAGRGFVHPAERFEEALRTEWNEISRMIPPGKDRYAHFPGGESEFWLRVVQGTLRRVTDEPLPDDLPASVLDALRDTFRHREAWEAFDDVVPTLEALPADGVSLGAVSNWDSRLPAVLERLELSAFFETVTVSSLEGVEKPDPMIFHRALESAGAQADLSIYVGDIPEIDLEGARAAGLRGVLIDRDGRLDPALGAIADLRVLPRLARGVET